MIARTPIISMRVKPDFCGVFIVFVVLMCR
jgi:hypothetical protein